MRIHEDEIHNDQPLLDKRQSRGGDGRKGGGGAFCR
jgi:hypothetical protein